MFYYTSIAYGYISSWYLIANICCYLLKSVVLESSAKQNLGCMLNWQPSPRSGLAEYSRTTDSWIIQHYRRVKVYIFDLLKHTRPLVGVKSFDLLKHTRPLVGVKSVDLKTHTPPGGS